MQITISAAECGFTNASGSITLTIEDERVRSQILALLLPGAPGVKADGGPSSASEPEPEPEPWQCGDILEGDRGQYPILVGYSGRWVEVWPYDRAEDFEPRVWSEARAFESFGPFRRIGCVAPVVVQRARGGDEEAAAAIVRAAYPEGAEG